MLLQNRPIKDLLIPHSSRCYITNRGIINDGDIISVISPLFSSMDYSSRAVQLSESFDVVFRTSETGGINITDEDNEAVLNSEDQDINHMYVTKEFGQ